MKKTLNNNEASCCEGLLTLDEGKQAILEMKTNKAPGLSGLTIEFYQTFWPKIGELVIKSLNVGYMKGELSSLQKQSVISLLYKKGDSNNLENWRPISLLNTDYKIGTRILAKRLQIILPKIISMDQQGYLKNRNICFNIRQIQDIIDYAEYFQIEASILFLDFRKAFDTVDRTFMIAVLKHFGFKESFISWIKTIYFNSSACILNKGFRSDFVALERGIRQGCPISALLFILVAEVMALNIKSNPLINGISIKTKNSVKRIKITQLADDTTLFFGSTLEIEIALDEIENFGKHSGLKLNRQKTEGLWVGNHISRDKKIGNINWSNGPIKALGIYFGQNKQECIRFNWEDKIKNVENIIKNWLKRNLIFFGKIKIIKTLILSKLVYLAQSITVPNDIIKTIDSLIYNFLWHGKREKIKRSTLIGQTEYGGIEMCDTQSFFKSLKFKWIKKLIDKTEANW